MAQDRIKKISKNYIIVISILFIIWFFLSLFSPLWFESGRELCVRVDYNEYYHFIIDSFKACRLDWSYVGKYFLGSFVVYAIIVGPAIALYTWRRFKAKEKVD